MKGWHAAAIWTISAAIIWLVLASSCQQQGSSRVAGWNYLNASTAVWDYRNPSDSVILPPIWNPRNPSYTPCTSWAENYPPDGAALNILPDEAPLLVMPRCDTCHGNSAVVGFYRYTSLSNMGHPQTYGE